MIRLCVALACLGASAGEDKWVWGGDSGRGRDALRGEHSVARPLVNINVDSSKAPLFQTAGSKKKGPQQTQSDDPGGQARYEVFENGPNDLPPVGRPPIRPPQQYPGRPQQFPDRPRPQQFPDRPGPQYPDRPGPQYPDGPRPQYPDGPRPQYPERPGFRPGPPPPRPAGPGGPPPHGGNGDPNLGVLTGPVPSWERPGPQLHKNGDPTSFDSCKCVNSFNCKSPGLKFGSCDAGKVYCCTNSPGFGVYPAGGGGGFGDKGAGGPPVLAGPGGPRDGDRPGFYRPPPPGGPLPDEPFYGRPPPGGFGGPGGPGPRPLPFDDDIVPRSASKGKPRL